MEVAGRGPILPIYFIITRGEIKLSQMSLPTLIFSVSCLFVSLIIYDAFHSLFFSPLARIPGPKLYALTKLRLAYDDYRGSRTRVIHRLHLKYGPVIRIGPSEVSFNSLSALRKIYGAGGTFGRPRSFYHVFDIYGQLHMFTFYSSAEHSSRKRMLSQLYAKSNVLKGSTADSIHNKVAQFVRLVEFGDGNVRDLAQSLHYFSLDNITAVVFGGIRGATSALVGTAGDKQILSDIEQDTARRYSWFQLHLPRYTAFAMSCGPIVGATLDILGLRPGAKPIAYSGLQDYAMRTFESHLQDQAVTSDTESLISQLLGKKAALGEGGLTDLDIAAECADHLDAGLKTTSDTLLFAIWALSLPENRHHQQRLASEARAMMSCDIEREETDPSPSPAACDSLPFLDAVVKETLRLYAPIPASQPRMSTNDVVIDGYTIPAGTIVSCQAYSIHRNPDVFPHAYEFNPDRWLTGEEQLVEMRRWWWPFSSGGRMCLGMQYVYLSIIFHDYDLRVGANDTGWSLALAEMKTLLATLYVKYESTLSEEFQGASPAATSRFEHVYDDMFPIAKVGLLLDDVGHFYSLCLGYPLLCFF